MFKKLIILLFFIAILFVPGLSYGSIARIWSNPKLSVTLFGAQSVQLGTPMKIPGTLKSNFKSVKNVNLGAACEPSCTNRSCGDDGCGGSCGTCAGVICVRNMDSV
jgi:hypothetical protein